MTMEVTYKNVENFFNNFSTKLIQNANKILKCIVRAYTNVRVNVFKTKIPLINLLEGTSGVTRTFVLVASLRKAQADEKHQSLTRGRCTLHSNTSVFLFLITC